MNEDISELLEFMTPEERAQLDALLPKDGVWYPQPGPQAQAYYCEADILGFGGGGGGGKTELLIGLALTQHRRSAIFRRESTNLNAIIDRVNEIIAAKGQLNRNLGLLRMPDGRQIEFQGCKDPGDEQKQRGRPRDFLGFDEADQLLEHQYRFITGWLRSTDARQRKRIVLTFNPPSSSDGRWLIEYFGPWIDKRHPHPAEPGEIRWYSTLSSGKEIEVESGEPFEYEGRTVTPLSRTFIPALVTDNKYLRDTNYVAVLQSLEEPLRSQLLNGDFSACIEDDPWQVIPTEWVDLAMARWTGTPPANEPLTAMGVDPARGGRDKTVIAKRYANWFAPLEKHLGVLTPDGLSVANLVAEAHSDRAAINIDVIGIGASAYDHVKENEVIGKYAVPINNAEGSEERDRSGKYRLVNVRAASWWKFREALDPEHGDNIALPPDRELKADLIAPRYCVTTRGRQVESKEDIIKRLKRSPDCGDAVVMAHWMGPIQLEAWVLG